MIHPWTVAFGYIICAATAAYGIIALIAIRTRIRAVPHSTGDCQPVTVLKPLCGAEPETYDCLRSFCDQDYPHFQVIFGVSDPHDPVIAIVHRLQREFPDRDLRLHVDRTVHGTSRKVSNLINMMPSARHGYLVISDSDVRVARDYLAEVVAPLRDRGVGIVTCAYRGLERRNLWSLLGAMYVNEWFAPSVRVAAMFGSRAFAFGATIAMRAEVLAAAGGFSAIANQLADDYRLGELTRRMGLRTVLSQVRVDTYVCQQSLPDLVRHELRWLRTIRALRPVGYGLSFVTMGIPVALMGVWLSGGSRACVAAASITTACRLMIHISTRATRATPLLAALIAVRDTLTLVLWMWSFTSRRVQWREDSFRIRDDGSAQRILGT